MTARGELATVVALVRRALNEIVRVRGAAIPGVLAPTLFMLGITGVFAELSELQGFTADSFISFLIPVSMMQAAVFTGAATGVNLARDIEQGWFDRLLLAPASRPVLLAGIVLSASLRSLIPVSLLLTVGFALGAEFPGAGALALAIGLIMAMAMMAGCWGAALALKFKTQSAAPLMQAGMLILVFLTPAYVPLNLLTGWVQDFAEFNPFTQIVDATRQGFVGGGVTWSETWPGLLVLAGLLILLAGLALRGIRRTAA